MFMVVLSSLYGSDLGIVSDLRQRASKARAAHERSGQECRNDGGAAGALPHGRVPAGVPSLQRAQHRGGVAWPRPGAASLSSPILAGRRPPTPPQPNGAPLIFRTLPASPLHPAASP